jgi:hypothetical protein
MRLVESESPEAMPWYMVEYFDQEGQCYFIGFTRAWSRREAAWEFNENRRPESSWDASRIFAYDYDLYPDEPILCPGH